MRRKKRRPDDSVGHLLRLSVVDLAYANLITVLVGATVVYLGADVASKIYHQPLTTDT